MVEIVNCFLVIVAGDGEGESRIHVDWVTREKIALGTARALAYLHKESVKLPHGNIRSSNVLLNRALEPFLSDYALIPLLNPANVAASRFTGYQAPEVTDIRKITLESDVYSFGVVRQIFPQLEYDPNHDMNTRIHS